jgi:hypothetical protein
MHFRWLILFAVVATPLMAANDTVRTIDRGAIDACQASDREAVLIYRDGLHALIAHMDRRPDLFPPASEREPLILDEVRRRNARIVWQSFLDYMLALESIRTFHSDFADLRGARKKASFEIMNAAFLAQYRAALAFIERAERNPGYRKQFDEDLPELGLAAGSYSLLKFRYLNVAIAARFVALDAMRAATRPGASPLTAAASEDRAAILAAGRGTGPALTAINAVEVVKGIGKDIWLPVQTGVANWMGDTRVYREGISLIPAAEISELPGELEPGDVLFQRREWYLSNIGLPGFWTHAALYVGTPDDRRRAFDDDETREWVRSMGEESGELEALLASRYPEATREARKKEGGHPRRVIEAIGEGVLFTTLEHSAAADSMAVLRPRLTAKEKAIGIYRAFGYAGRPYDFDFDFLTDDRLVCSELVYKAYEKGDGMTGLTLEMNEVAGRKVIPPNEMVRQFDGEYATERQQFDFVFFLDGRERPRRAVRSDVEELRKSWKRPRWHVVAVAVEGGR